MLNILILCEKESSAQLDRRSLRELGFGNARVMTSGIEAARLLARELDGPDRIDLAVCHDRLGDMRYGQFYDIARAHPRLKTFPILVIPDDAREAGIEQSGREFCDILPRPFSPDALRRKIEALILKARAAEKSAPPWDGDDSAFERALASYGLLLRQEHSTDEYFHMGMGFLKEQNWSLAISAFQKSVQDHRLKAEAELGMAAAYKGHNDLINFRASLASAAEAFVKSGRWTRGRSAYARLLQHDKSAKNPFLAEAQRRIKRGDYTEAANILRESLPLIPKGLAGPKLARLCFFAPEPEAMRAALEEALDSEGAAVLKAEISHNLHLLNREKEERERRKNAERKWEINRQAREREREEKNAPDNSGRPELRVEETISLFEEDGNPGGSSNEEDFEEDWRGIGDEGGDNPPALQPLGRPEATTDLFTKKPRFNEFLSVIKLTWKLARLSKKRE